MMSGVSIREVREIAACCLVLVFGVPCLAGNWPGWRGPGQDGVSSETGVPVKWSATENIAWKTALPGEGHASPIVWGDYIFTVTAMPATRERVLLCLDRKTGKLLWQKTVVTAPLEAKHKENSYASSTPVTDGEKVYVAFMEGGKVAVAAYDFKGEQKWIVRPGRFDSGWGFCHSPILHDKKVYIACCGRTSGFVGALDCADGKTVWSVEPVKSVQSFSTPLVKKMAGRVQVIVPGNSMVSSYDATDGKLLWTVDGPSKEYVASPVYNEKAGLVLCGSSWPNRILVAIKPDGQGDVTAGKVAWKSQEGASYVPSAMSIGDYFMISSFEGGKSLYCFDAASGKVVWKAEGVGLHHSSPVTAGGMVYFLNDDGVMNVVKAGSAYELVAKNELGEQTYASPAISDGQIFIRGFKNLYCIGTGAQKP